jgi:hypothetical protein
MRWLTVRHGVNGKAAGPAASRWEPEYIRHDLPRARPRLTAAEAATPDTPPMRLSSLPLALAVAMAASAAAAQLQNENLLVTVPDGFKIDFQQKNKEMLISEMVPGAESVNDWTQMVTVQIFFGLKSGAGGVQEQGRNGLGARVPRKLGACGRAGEGERLSLRRVAARLSSQQDHGQAGIHLVQGDAGQRQSLRRPGGAQGEAD